MAEKKRVRGGVLLARALHRKGVEHVFTLAGGFCNPALEGFMECGLSIINCPHEQTAGHLADGHTRITRRPAVCLVGPEGFANAVPAMMEAWGERSPVIFVTGSSTLKRRGAGGFKEIDDVAIAAPLTKFSASITDGARISEFVDRAFKIAQSGYPGAVHLSLPVDIMFSSFDEDAGLAERPFERAHRPPARAWPEPARLAEAVGLVAEAKRPLLIGGHGVWWSGREDQLKTAAARLGIPVFNIPYHRKLLPAESAAHMGLADIHQYPPAKFALEEADVVVMCGGRLDNQMNFGNPPLIPKTAKLICVNGSHEEVDLNRAADCTLLSDPGAFLDALLDAEKNGRWNLAADWLGLNREKRRAWAEHTLSDLKKETARAEADGGKIHPLQLALDVQSAMGGGDWLVIDGGNTHFWSEIAVNLAGWQGKKLGGILHPGAFSMLGAGVAFAVAAKNVHPKSTVVLLSGDGAFLSGGLSVEVAFQEKLPVVVVIDNNGGLGCIAQQQERLFASGAHFATDFRDIPFHSMFEGLGGHGELVETREQLLPALRRAMASGKTACVNVKAKGAISPIVLATADKREKASIE
ncbi:MAG: thiamine pyrophosphate-binding protein [Gammaproteobacteria bacterium]|nr:thiamine pyrophosphate-binding protein [Gammaproteobacteria bacterium]MDD9871581.1 thiamine pyrophosphate-binding protein [Gammaproteobacteria bacterium]